MAAIANQMMDINSQYHNLLGNKILPKSEDFCILAAILDSKWPPSFTEEMLHHMATILVCYGSHFESKMAAKIQKSSDLGKILFPSRF
jgi:hypothetical protein